MDIKKLPIANLKGSPGRTVGLALLCALLAFALFAGTVAATSLQNGLASLVNRLGADVVVAPAQAKSKTSLEDVLLEGTPGQFYMDRAYVDRIAAVGGVEAVSPQYYLATVKAGCCTIPVQIIGFDPETDFVIQPWIARSYGSDLGREDVVTGCNVSGAPGSTILFYGVECRIVGRLDKTGTQLDNAVFATNETLQDLIKGSQEQGISVLSGNDPSQVVSTVQVKVADGYDPEEVAGRINVHERGVSAVQTRAMVSGVADSMQGVSRTIGMLAAALAVAAVVFLVLAFALSARGRTREFAVLRMMGASRPMLLRVVSVEALAVGCAGALVGLVAGMVVFFAFGGLVESQLGVPFLLPEPARVALFAAVAFVVTVLACSVVQAVSSLRLVRADAGLVLREA